MPGGIDKLAKSTLRNQGLGDGLSSSGNQTERNIYPAIVINNEDPLGMKRIVARIISLDENNEINGGRDRDTPDDQLPFCVPMLPNHFHILPLVDEMVYVFLENPSDNSAPRYYIGPEINNQLKLKFQTYADANSVFDYTNFNLNRNKDNSPEIARVFPKEGDVALQGRTDADVILKPREVYLVAGKLNQDSSEINTETPSSIQIIQKRNDENNAELIPRYSQANITSTNINLYSVRGTFRDEAIANFEINEDLKSFDGVASTLHPTVFGDELIKLLDLIITVLLNHIHTPHKPLLATPESDEISSYTVDGNLQRIISNHVRIN